MKIGLMTVYFADYGSYYHTIALYEAIKGLGYDCEIINESLRYKYSKKLAVSNLVSTHFKSASRLIAKKVTPFRTYNVLKEELKKYKISRRFRSLSEIQNEYDAIVVGSDELWSCTNSNMLFVPEYYGIGIDIPHITYSTSGITLKNPSEQQKNLMKKGISTFSSLAVRDEITADWVFKLTGRKCEIVLDPTLLNPFFKVENPVKEDYITVYGEHFDDNQKKAILDYAKQKGLKLKAVAWKHDWCDEFAEVTDSKMLQEVFAKGRCCMSSTFHGSIFSIVQEVPFTSFLSELRGAKVRCLLKSLCLEDRIFNGKIADENMDYAEIESRLNELRKKSLNYLCKSLKQIEHEGTD